MRTYGSVWCTWVGGGALLLCLDGGAFHLFGWGGSAFLLLLLCSSDILVCVFHCLLMLFTLCFSILFPESKYTSLVLVRLRSVRMTTALCPTRHWMTMRIFTMVQC